MYRATEYRFQRALVFALLSCGCALAQAQSIADYSRAQRAALEAEMARNNAKAMGSGATAQGNTPVSPAMAPKPFVGMPVMPPAPTEALMDAQPVAHPAVQPDEITISGVIVLVSRAMVELKAHGETYLLLVGDKIPGTPWVVQSIKEDRVVLNSGRQSRTFNLTAGVP